MGNFSKLFNKITDTQVQPGDETAEANNLRNKLANAVNPMLEEYVNPVLPEWAQMAIPKMTVADEKQYFQELPENMAGATMGSVKDVGGRFGKLIPPGKPNYGTVTVKPSAADLAADAQKAKLTQSAAERMAKKTDISQEFYKKYGQELERRRADKNLTPDMVTSWAQDMINNIRRERGEL